jgi:hypothetical protein
MVKCKNVDCFNDLVFPKKVCVECQKKRAAERDKKWKEENKEHREQYHKEYRKKNKDQKSIDNKKYREKNREALNDHHKQWYRENIDRERIKEAIFNRRPERRFYVAKRVAKTRSINFSLTFEQYKNLISLPCYYCDNKLCDLIQTGGGLDRVNNTLGYELDNVVSCGKICNAIKMDYLSAQETKAAVEAILQIRYPNDSSASNKL